MTTTTLLSSNNSQTAGAVTTRSRRSSFTKQHTTTTCTTNNNTTTTTTNNSSSGQRMVMNTHTNNNNSLTQRTTPNPFFCDAPVVLSPHHQPQPYNELSQQQQLQYYQQQQLYYQQQQQLNGGGSNRTCANNSMSYGAGLSAGSPPVVTTTTTTAASQLSPPPPITRNSYLYAAPQQAPNSYFTNNNAAPASPFSAPQTMSHNNNHSTHQQQQQNNASSFGVPQLSTMTNPRRPSSPRPPMINQPYLPRASSPSRDSALKEFNNNTQQEDPLSSLPRLLPRSKLAPRHTSRSLVGGISASPPYNYNNTFNNNFNNNNYSGIPSSDRSVFSEVVGGVTNNNLSSAPFSPQPYQHSRSHRHHINQAPPSPSGRSVVSESYITDHHQHHLVLSHLIPAEEVTAVPRDDDDDFVDDCSSLGGGGVGSVLSHRTDPERRREIRVMAQNRITKLKRQRQQQQQQQRQPSPSTIPSGIDCATTTNERKSPVLVVDDDVSSLGGVEDQSSAVLRITLAVRNQSARPSSLTREERSLWDVIQTAIRRSKRDAAAAAAAAIPVPSTAVADPKQQNNNNTNNTSDDAASAAAAESSELESTRRSLRAIQRVLADVTTERDRTLEELKTLKATVALEDSNRQREIATQTARITVLEQALQESDQSKQTSQEQQSSLQAELAASKAEKERLATDLAACRDELNKLSRNFLQNTEASNDITQVRKDLAEKTASLENAKMIIASLESANGSLASDMRAKLKHKEDEIVYLKKDAADRQKTLDSLAMQLRDLQKTTTHTNRHKRKQEERRRLAISSRLEKNMADMRAASVVLEATNDASAAEKMSDILSDSINALKEGIDLVDEYGDDCDSIASVNETSSFSSAVSRNNSPMPVDVMRLRRELDERAKSVARLEEALRKQKEETALIKKETDKNRQEEVESLRNELQSLRDQCQTYMDVLMRKERELQCLRDSLKVDDGVGYISDDGTDASEEDNDQEEQRSIPSSTHAAHLSLSQYGPSQAEALATLLAHGGNNNRGGGNNHPNNNSNNTINNSNNNSDAGSGSAISNSPSQDEFETLKRDLRQARLESERCRKQLKTEKESLANAKMIISSLEKANKSMMEDLRSRLQDSNTAIASLLEKSMDSEKNTNKLRAELDALRRDQQAEKERYENELKKYQQLQHHHHHQQQHHQTQQQQQLQQHPRALIQQQCRNQHPYHHHSSLQQQHSHPYQQQQSLSPSSHIKQFEEKKEELILATTMAETID